MGSDGKRTSPDRLPMDNFGIPNKVYRENSDSQPNTPAALKRIEEDFSDIAPGVVWNSNNNGNAQSKRASAAGKDSVDSSSSEDLTMTKL